MQWGLDGEPKWQAPRRAALAFIPAVGAVVLAAATRGEHGGVGATLFAASPPLGGQALHLVLIRRTR